MKNIYRRRANYYETDQMGIVHHSNHIRYFEEARLYYMHNIGCDAAEMERNGIIIPNVDAYAKYKSRFAFYNPDIVCIEVNLSGSTARFGSLNIRHGLRTVKTPPQVTQPIALSVRTSSRLH